MRSVPVRALLRFTAYLAGFSTLGLAVFLRATFGEVTVDQVVWHLRYADRPSIQLSEIFYVDAVVHVLVVPLVLALVATLAHGVAAARLAPWGRRVARALPALLVGSGLGAFALQCSAFSYVAAYLQPDLFEQHYVAPADVRVEAGQRRNLVLIYAESLETVYGEAGLFGKDLLAPLHASGGRSYPAYRQVSGATWTIAGMVATQCGVPLKVYAQADVQGPPDRRIFLGGATCLGDVLQAHGYRNVFLGGAPLPFAGKGRFLRDHGYQETWGREEWERAGARPDEFNVWGMYDAPLFERARAELERLHASGQPFNLTLLTLDTHNPFGFMSPGCRARGAAGFEGIVSCGAAQIAEFIAFARERGYLRDTAIVVIGDHLAMPNPVSDRMERAPGGRTIFNLFVGDALPPANTAELLPYDLFPTLLEIAGFNVTGDRLGLGESAVGPRRAPRPAQVTAELTSLATRPSAAYNRLWSSMEP